MEEGGREGEARRADGFPARDVRGAAVAAEEGRTSGTGEETSTGAPTAEHQKHARVHRTAVRPTPARWRSPQDVFPEDGGAGRAPRRHLGRRTQPPTDDGRPLSLSSTREAGTQEGLPFLDQKARGFPQRTRSAEARGRGAETPSNCSPARPSGSRTAAAARARACPAAPRRGSGSTAGSAGRGEPTEGGEGERHGRTRASDGRGDGNGPRKAPHPGTERPLGRQTDTRGKPTGITPPHDFLGQSRHACGTDPARNRRPPGEPGKTQHGRLPTPPPPPKTLEREWAPTRPATRRERPTVVPQRPHAPEREVDPARPGSPAPRRGNRSPVVPNRGNAAGEGGARRLHHAAAQATTRTRHTRHVRVAGTAKTGTRGRGPHAAGRRGEHVGEGDGWDPGSPPTTHEPPPSVPHIPRRPSNKTTRSPRAPNTPA